MVSDSSSNGRRLEASRRTPRVPFALFLSLIFLTFGNPLAHAAPVQTGFSEALVANGLVNPTAMEFAPDGRLFVCEQAGKLRVIKNGVLLATPFLSLAVNSSGERGLLGVAFDPAFSTNGYVYVYYTVPSPLHNRVSRFRANGDVAVAGSETVLFDLDLLGASNHNGGAIHFGQDGKLYIGAGDNAVSTNAQSLTTVLGKILRINPDGSIPTDNPFYGSTTGANRAIWAYGLRNPFTFAFSRTGALRINDVGQSSWEEINNGVAGANYGWPTTEGPTTDSRFVAPLYAYKHSNATIQGCAIAGGAYYDPATGQFPGEYDGDYFFADYCSGNIYRLRASTNAAEIFDTGIASLVDLKVGSDGSLYYLARGDGAVYRVSYNSLGPSITSHPASVTVAPGQPATFTVEASGAAPLSYQWQRGGVNIAGATGTSYTLASPQLADNGARFHAVVTNASGSVTSNDAELTVTTNAAPVATIVDPPEGTLYSGGSTINVRGTGTDAEDGTLPASAFTWEVVFHHEAHTHPFIAPTSGSKTGAFTIATTGETAADVFYRIHLTVRDSAGLTTSVYRDVLPRTATVTLATQPSGLELTLDGQPHTAPTTFTGVVGILRDLGVTTPQTVGGITYDFQSWSDSGAASHTISTPGAATTYTATFVARPSGCTAAPGAPSNLAWTRSGGNVTLTWTASPAGANAATSYLVEAGSSSGATNLGTTQTADASTTMIFAAPVGTYYLRVKGQNTCGIGPASNEVVVR
jgi:glucose/arabinose dehydrogenase